MRSAHCVLRAATKKPADGANDCLEDVSASSRVDRDLGAVVPTPFASDRKPMPLPVLVTERPTFVGFSFAAITAPLLP
jgi:hypothetical protein